MAGEEAVQRVTHPDGVIALHFGEKLTARQVETIWPRLDELLHDASPLRLDLSNVQNFDSAGIALVLEIRRRVPTSELFGVSEAVEGMFDLVEGETLLRLPIPPPREKINPFVQIGGFMIVLFADTLRMIRFVGESSITLLQVLMNPKRLLRKGDVLYYMERCGPDAIGIVSMISFLMGLTLAFQGANLLKLYGAEIYCANLVAVSMVRELGPLMTAIIMAGRSGAAFAAEIGTMKVNEEVDALVTMGFQTNRFLVIPKVLALAAMMPCLVMVADFVGIAAGFIVGLGIMDIAYNAYWNQTVNAITLKDVLSGLFKSGVFAFLVAGIGCLRGFETKGSAQSVGESTTSAVVSGIFLIILGDAVFTVIFHFLKI
jgi:phospholipid/cholesterol/gamma-HCH transport system permease protein